MGSYGLWMDEESFDYPEDPYQLDEVGIGTVTSLEDDGVGTYLSVLISAHNSYEGGAFHFVVSPEDALKVAALILDSVVLIKASLTETE